MAYGGSISNFDPNDPNQKWIADIGTQWANAQAQGATQAQLDAIHQQAVVIGKAAGATFNSQTGKWTFPQVISTAGTDQFPTSTAVSGAVTGGIKSLLNGSLLNSGSANNLLGMGAGIFFLVIIISIFRR